MQEKFIVKDYLKKTSIQQEDIDSIMQWFKELITGMQNQEYINIFNNTYIGETKNIYHELIYEVVFIAMICGIIKEEVQFDFEGLLELKDYPILLLFKKELFLRSIPKKIIVSKKCFNERVDNYNFL